MERPKVPKKNRHIVAMGGGVTSLDVLGYALGLSRKKNPKALIINTATGDKAEYLEMSAKRLESLGATVSQLLLFERTPPDLSALILSQDVIVVGGGNTKSMLAVWREYGIDEILREAWKRGVVLCGGSAGGICWFESCVTDSWDGDYTALPALGILQGSCCPHYDGEPGRQAAYHRLLKAGEVDRLGYAIDEGVGMHFRGKKLLRVVTPKKESSARTVSCRKGEVKEYVLPAQLLSSKK